MQPIQEEIKRPGLIRLVIAALSLIFVWGGVSYYFISFQTQLIFFFGFFGLYFLLAYLFLPRLIYVVTLLLRRSRIPRYTHAADGVLADPVNIILFGREEDLLAAFRQADWEQADTLTLRSAWRMFKTFFFDKPYPRAPFSPLFLFGRKHDYGFQKAIGGSPRMRHHVRFWAANVQSEIDLEDPRYWFGQNPVDTEKPLMWVGAASKDIGFGLTRFTYQLTHQVDEQVDKEREYLLDSLLSVASITDIKLFATEALVRGKYISDSRIITAYLKHLV